jgi:exopolysaccharide biosynthesis WecB/TagA/CpsF family protein
MAFADTWFLGVRYTLMDLRQAVAAVAGRSPQAPFTYLTTPNAQHTVLYNRITEGRGDGRILRAQDEAWINLLDSRVLSLLGRQFFGLRMPVATGSDLTARLLGEVIMPDEPVTVIGGDQGVAERLRQRYGLTNLHLYGPPKGFIERRTDTERCVAFARAHPARFTFIACGFPRSEILAHAMQERGDMTGIGLCVGASLLFVTGMVRRAPAAWSLLGLEWLYRILQEPRRMVPRLVSEQLPVLLLVLRARLSPREDRHSRRTGLLDRRQRDRAPVPMAIRQARPAEDVLASASSRHHDRVGNELG